MLLSASLFIVSAFTFCSAAIPNIGPCGVNIETQANFDFVKFHTEKGGLWKAVHGPDTQFNKNLSTLTIKITPTGKSQYRDVISYSTKDGKSGILADEVITNNGNGVCTATTTDGQVFQINVLKYVPGRFNFYYICSTDGTDKSTDYRYVLAHDALTPAELEDITALDKKFGFKGNLIPIG